MEKKTYQYTVVRYVPDLIKNEPRNIGVILICREVGYINCRFSKNLHARLGSAASSLDIKILKAYMEDFSASFRLFAEYPSTDNFLKSHAEFFKENYLQDISAKGMGKIQFGTPTGGLTVNPEKEMEYLFNTFVGDEQSKAYPKHSHLKTEIKKEFNVRKWLAIPQKRKVGFEVDYKMSESKSSVEYPFDFALRNGRLHLVETVDLRKKDKKLWDAETFQTALKFDDLKHGLVERNKIDGIEPYSIVALAAHEDATFHLKILKAYSNVFIYTDEKEKSNFLQKMKSLMSAPDIF